MPTTLLTFLLLAGAFPPCAQEPAAVRLFDGTTLEGWEGDPRFWSARGGAIVGESTAREPCARTSYLVWTGGAVRDFELELEFRITGGNSGVQFRSRLDPEHAVAGYQADIEDGPSWTGCLYEQGGREVAATRGQIVRFAPGGARTVVDFADSQELLARVRPREWNRYRIRAAGTRIDLEVNGAVFCTVVDEDPAFAAASGLVALQLHAGPPMKVEFRGLELRRLDVLPPLPPLPSPRWIWSRREAADQEQAWLYKAFEVAGEVRSARLEGCADNACCVWLNGEVVLEHDDWLKPVLADVGRQVKPGANALAVWAKNASSVAAVQLALDLVLADGSLHRVATDGSWLAASEEPPEGWLQTGPTSACFAPAVELGALGDAPWKALPAPVPAALARALAPEELRLPKGFAAELVYSVPKAREGSWISLCEDDRGRFYASDQYGSLYRVTPRPIGGEGATRVERVRISLGQAHGLAWAFGSLYAVVSCGSRPDGLYRARDTDGDDRLDAVDTLFLFDQRGGEHGPHAVVPGPDGAGGESLWIVAGNFTSLPDGLAASRVPRAWGEDQLLPSHPDGHDPLVTAPGGWIARTDREGKRWELVASGLRNAYDLAFDGEGEAFTFDSDMEWDSGLPWYRPTRILHAVSGAEFGFRSGSGKWPACYPDSLPAAVDVGLASPTGVTFAAGARFPAPWSKALYAADWAYGRIWAVHLQPDGASYRGRAEVFVEGQPLPVTDLSVARDGALYFVTGGRGTQSGLYRVRWVEGPVPNVAPAPVWTEGRAAREQRRELERLHQVAPDSSGTPPEPVWRGLASPDRFVRFAARTALEHRPLRAWKDRALAERDPRALVQALVALARQAPAEVASPDLEELARSFHAAWDRIPIETLSPEDSIDAVRALALACIRLGDPPPPAARRAIARLDARLPSGDAALDRELARMLVRLEAPGVVAKSLALSASAASQEDAIHYLWILRTLRAGWTLAARAELFERVDALRARARGGASCTRFLDAIREDALATLSGEEREALAAVLAPPGTASPASGPVATLVEHWTLSDLAPALETVRRGRSFARGKAAYARARCLECHRIAGEGGATGPDLSGAGGRFNPLDLMEALLLPSKVISDQYRDVEVLTLDEELFVGRLEREDERTLWLRTLPPAEELVELEKSAVARRRSSPLSRMPEGLLDVLTKEEILDLLAYVLAGGREDGTAFQ